MIIFDSLQSNNRGGNTCDEDIIVITVIAVEVSRERPVRTAASPADLSRIQLLNRRRWLCDPFQYVARAAAEETCRRRRRRV